MLNIKRIFTPILMGLLITLIFVGQAAAEGGSDNNRDDCYWENIYDIYNGMHNDMINQDDPCCPDPYGCYYDKGQNIDHNNDPHSESCSYSQELICIDSYENPFHYSCTIICTPQFPSNPPPDDSNGGRLTTTF